DPQTAFAATEESAGETAEEQPQGDASASPDASATADEPADEETAAAAADDATSDEGSATSTVALWAGLAVLVLVLGVGLTVLRGRRARAIADREADGS
ncbi:hypothetical protein, partial [Cellulosimicrobium cellulans]|uniref:hypothetical protein n=1 Tax=Cellulosimicrobium cellulans TaxID=1710 RepID=UPI000ABA0041